MMICGSFNLKPDPSLPPAKSRRVTGSEDLTFHPVSSGWFSGGYYLNKRLPFTGDDFFWHDETSGLTVLLSGAVYNRIELADVLNLNHTITDPELTGRLFLKQGPEFVRDLNGDFAVFIMRSQAREAWLFRDHVGIRPLAYSIRESTLHFSTNITALCIDLSDGEGMDTNYLTGHFRYIDYRTTPSSKVKKLLPGHYLHFTDTGANTVKFWEPEKIRHDRTLTRYGVLSELDNLIRDAVKIRCDNRFSAGAHVSSGLDSGLVALLARDECRNQSSFYGFSWSPDGYTPGTVRYDERVLVRRLCEGHGITPLFSEMNFSGFKEAVSGFDINHGYFSEDAVVKQAQDAGVNMIFSGWGGDEFVSTSAPSIETDLLRGLKLRLYFRRNELRKPVRFLKNVVKYILMPAMGIHARGTVQALRDEARYLRPQWKKSDRRAVRQFYFHTSRRGHHLGMLRFYHLQSRCEKWFTMGYRYGVEYRYPLLDRRIIELMLRVSSELLCATGYFRPLLREISEGILPDEIRLNMSKVDPVYREYLAGLYRDAAGSFLEEAEKWRDNPDLQFIDFDLLASDIEGYRRGDPTVSEKVLFRGLIYIKAMDGLTRSYISTLIN